ncbi:DUF1800 domain-containing protein [Thiolapillus brandeum]|uniref:DUF1800 domain-containing protein n=1 Tax=Thiolapillus brandeum TaxID=1076588 RepID=A0A7U6GK80_9GAMM|nr:DUF1800 domain-containing protein [Thiolapillus brandeum]BAO45178.1 conserved hypothetical protein [Thiolapillus brandeum]
MDLQRRALFGKAAAFAASTSTGISEAAETQQPDQSLPAPSADILTLGRCTFGITDALIRQMDRLGRRNWLEQQLDWEAIDDSLLEEQLHEQTPTIYMSESELANLENGFQAANQLKQATLFRAMFSPRQLYEVMVEFWSNHFSIYHRDGPVVRLKTIDDREVIRPHALGSFRDLLHASSKSPAMLLYLDNHTNVAGTPNENYARELMELHTLGVNGGYTETDVQEVARCFTGWAVASRRSLNVGQFHFYPNRHDQGSKTVLGTHIAAGGGIRDGEKVVDILAGHPSTAHFISTKLARHFVSDQPPDSLVDRMTRVFLDTDGDIPSLLREMLDSEEFLSSVDEKLKRPVEYILSALRSTRTSLKRPSYARLREYLLALGQIPFEWVPPDGYPDSAGYWTSTNGMLNRWNFSSSLAGGVLPGISIDYLRLSGGSNRPDEIVDHLARQLLHRSLNPAHRDSFIAFLNGDQPSSGRLDDAAIHSRVPALIGLMLSSPYFQYR